MSEEMKSTWRRLSGSANRRRLLIWAGVAGILLIALSEWLPRRPASLPTGPESVTADQVERAMEKRITALLGVVEGVGDCRVMVTLENGGRAVYAADTSLSLSGDGQKSTTEEILTVDTDTGPVGLLLTHLQPSVKGVAVVCAGGGDPTVCDRVTAVVSTAFHISPRRVAVVRKQQ